MHCIGDNPMARSFFLSIELGRRRQWLPVFVGHHHAPFFVGRDATGDDHAYTTRGPLSVKRGHALEPVRLLLQAGVHRTHDATITQLRMPEIQWRKQVWVTGISRQISFGIHSNNVSHSVTNWPGTLTQATH